MTDHLKLARDAEALAERLTAKQRRAVMHADGWAVSVMRPSQDGELISMGILKEPSNGWEKATLQDRIFMPMFFGFGSLTAREICTTVLTPLGKQVAAALEPTP